MAGIDPVNGSAPARLLQVRQQAEELEGVFLTMLTKEMFASVKPNEALGGGGFGEETWRSMQAEQLADAMARAGGIGIADDLVRQMLDLQETAGGVPAIPHSLSGIGVYGK